MKKKIKNANIYTALGICAVAVAVASVISIAPGKKQNEQAESGFTRVSIKWSERADENTVPQTDAVDVGVTGIEDDRTRETELSTESNKPFTGDFVLPMGNDIIKDFSNGEMVYNLTLDDWRVHNGVDFAGTPGGRVNAVADGKITAVYEDSFLGTVVEVDHGNGMVSVYCGLNKETALTEGDSVKKGDRIGSLGDIPAEASDVEHLHFEVKIDGKTVDPLAALNKIGEE